MNHHSLRRRLLSLSAGMLAAVISASVASAQSTTLFYEDFSDAELAPEARINMANIAGGIASFTDASTTSRARFTVVQTYDQPLLTFQFDIMAPVVPTSPARMELLLRAGEGTAHNTMSSGESVVEAVAFRGLDATGTRVGESIENKTVFLIYNNKDMPESITSPIDSTEVILPAWSYITYTFDRVAETFAPLPVGITHANPAATEPARDITRFGLGSSTNSDLGTFALDNILLRSGVFFDRDFPDVPPPGLVGDFDDSNTVDGADLTVWKASFAVDAGADADNDGDSDGNDLLLWQRNLGASAPVAAAVPEPASSLLFVFAAAAGLSMFRRSIE
jgi:hypothetical protein